MKADMTILDGDRIQIKRLLAEESRKGNSILKTRSFQLFGIIFKEDLSILH